MERFSLQHSERAASAEGGGNVRESGVTSRVSPGYWRVRMCRCVRSRKLSSVRIPADLQLQIHKLSVLREPFIDT